jgi:hypothetical protein
VESSCEFGIEPSGLLEMLGTMDLSSSAQLNGVRRAPTTACFQCDGT